MVRRIELHQEVSERLLRHRRVRGKLLEVLAQGRGRGGARSRLRRRPRRISSRATGEVDEVADVEGSSESGRLAEIFLEPAKL